MDQQTTPQSESGILSSRKNPLNGLKKISFPKNGKKLIFPGIIIAILLIGLGWFYFGGYTINHLPQEGGEYTEALVGEPQFVNPLFSSSRDADQDITSLVFSGLMKYNTSGELVTDLAESYEVSEDQKNFTFKLRDDIYWHDGVKITADDVVFTSQLIKNPDVKSPLRSSLASVAIEKIDDYTVKFTLTKDAYSPFLKENSTFGILPKHIWEETVPASIQLAERNLKPVGSGPYIFKEYKKDKKTGTILNYTLEKNPEYFGEKPYIEFITFIFYTDWDTALEAYAKGDVMGVSYIPPESKQYISDKLRKNSSFYNLRLPRYYALFFNWQNNPILKERNVRRAIAHSIDQEKIISQALDGDAYPVHSAILPNFLGHNSEIKGYEFNIEKAKEELEKAGWTIGEDGMRWKNNAKLEFTLSITDKETFISTAEIMQEDLAKAGIQMNIEALDPATMQTSVIKLRGYEAVIYGQLLLHDPDPYSFWHSTERQDPGLNLTSYNSPEVDDLLEGARKTGNEEERIKKYLHFQNTLFEEVPAVFLYSPTYLYSASNKVRGVSAEYVTFPSDRFANIGSWYVNTKPTIEKK